MIDLFSILVLGTVVSLDSFGVGFSYGLKHITITLKSILIIILCSKLALILAMKIGNIITLFIPQEHTEKFGAFAMIMIGLLSLYNVIKKKIKAFENKELLILKTFNINISNYKIIIEIIKKPTPSRTGLINLKESILLGLILACDSFGAGIAASLMGYSLILTVILISLMSGLFVFMGMKFGLTLNKIAFINKINYLPSIILIMIGISKLF